MQNRKIPLTEKYRPATLSEIKGQDLAIDEIKVFLRLFPRKKAIILNGPAGIGKTTIAIALAKEFNLELFELNASDLRNKSKLDEILKPATFQKSLFKKGKLIFMDEADGITSNDRGGLPELLTLLTTSAHPIVITANDIWQKKYSLLRQKCQLISLKELRTETVRGVLMDILKKENKSIQLETINKIAEKSKGDMRAAINDLQTVIERGEEQFVCDIHEREKEESIFHALKRLFQNITNHDTISEFDNVSLEADEILLWIEENIPMEYQGEALVKAYDALSNADLFKGRVYRQQHWRFLVYQNFFLSAGISSASKVKAKKFNNYQRPTRILKIWLANQKNAKKKSIVNKYAKMTHMSKKKAMKESFLIPLIIDQATSKKMDLDEKEEKYLEEKRGAIIVSNNLNKFRL